MVCGHITRARIPQKNIFVIYVPKSTYYMWCLTSVIVTINFAELRQLRLKNKREIARSQLRGYLLLTGLNWQPLTPVYALPKIVSDYLKLTKLDIYTCPNFRQNLQFRPLRMAIVGYLMTG